MKRIVILLACLTAFLCVSLTSFAAVHYWNVESMASTVIYAPGIICPDEAEEVVVVSDGEDHICAACNIN